ncbi:MAG TPA: lysogenization regulator HflD [Thiothrix sp.]|nr:lysogenization regulator HflD [Thiothrix sp.]
MQNTTENRTIALAALFQCVEGVSQLANTGKIDNKLLTTCLRSTLVKEANTIEDIYGTLSNLETGFRTLKSELSTKQLSPEGTVKNFQLTHYAINLLHLEKKLGANEVMFNKLLEGIDDMQRQLEHFEITHTTIISRLADIYSETISKLGSRIMVKGNQDYLGNTDNAAKIRALLLAGVRAALLWQQAGGGRWKLLFERGKMQRQADIFLAEIKATST